MSKVTSYRGYTAQIDYDDEDRIITGRLVGIRDGVGFHSDTVEGLREAFHEAVEDYLKACAKIGKDPQRAYSGQMMYPRWTRTCTAARPWRRNWRGKA